MCLHGPAFVNYRRRAGDLPVLVHVVSQRARVLRLRRTGQPLASNAAAVLPSSYSSGSRHPDLAFFEAQSPRPPMPRSTLRNTPRDVPRKTRGQDGVAFSFPVGLLHPLQHAGLSRRTTYNAQSVEMAVWPSNFADWERQSPFTCLIRAVPLLLAIRLRQVRTSGA